MLQTLLASYLSGLVIDLRWRQKQLELEMFNTYENTAVPGGQREVHVVSDEMCGVPGIDLCFLSQLLSHQHLLHDGHERFNGVAFFRRSS